MADAPQIHLKILSPSTEIESGINFPDISAATTVKELRTRIQNEIPSRPALERMRLIYRGRVVVNDTETLADVFGLENIRNSREQTLHLVLREIPSSTSSTPVPRNATSPAPRSATVPPNPFRPVQTPPLPQQQPQAIPTPTNPFRPVGQPPQAQMPHHHHHHHHHQAHHHNPFPQNPFGALPIPPQVNNLFQQQIAQAMAQNLPQHNVPRIPTPNSIPGAQTPNQQSRGGTPAPRNGSPVPPGAAPFNIPGMPPANIPNMPPGTTRIVRQEGIGPNGERWSMTYNNTNITIPVGPQQIPILPRPFPHPPHFPGPERPPGQEGENMDQLLARVRNGLLAARQEMDNVRTLFQTQAGQAPQNNTFTSATPPSWRIERIRQHARSIGQNLDNVQIGLQSIIAEPALSQNQDVLSLQAAANDLRVHAEQLNHSLDDLQGIANPTSTPSTSDPSPSAAPSTSDTGAQAVATQAQRHQAASSSSLAESGPELFLLSSPQGPVGILFDQRGTFSTAPLVSTLPFQAFSQHFASNRQALVGLGQQMGNVPSQFAAPQPAQNQQPVIGAQPQPEQQNPQLQNQNHNQNQDQGQAPNAAGENDRLAVIAGHMWLLFKLVCFIYIFAGGSGWYRPIMMGIVGAVVYLAQLGIFENQFNMVRQHFEALLGLPGQNRQAQGANGQPQGQAQGAQVAEPGRNLTPEQAAQRLIQQRHEQRFGWIRDRTRTIERAFALFVASLWPGLGERMVQAQEERERAQRAAEEERQRREEEARQQEAQQAEQKHDGPGEKNQGEPSTDEAPAEASSSTKGKEKADVAVDDLA